jgi:parallel beta-helix repeat protein
VLSGPDSGFPQVSGVGDETPLQLVGILQADQRHKAGSTRIVDNLVFRNSFGIVAIDATNTIIRDNRTRNNGYGVVVWDTEGATVRGNDSGQNVVGIGVDDEPFFSGPADHYVAGGIVVRNNDARDNFALSCEDASAGLGDPNTWTANLGEPGSSDPLGICGDAGP